MTTVVALADWDVEARGEKEEAYPHAEEEEIRSGWWHLPSGIIINVDAALLLYCTHALNIYVICKFHP